MRLIATISGPAPRIRESIIGMSPVSERVMSIFLDILEYGPSTEGEIVISETEV